MEAVNLAADKASLRRHFIQTRQSVKPTSEARRLLSIHLDRLIRDLTTAQTQILLHCPLKNEARFDLEGSYFYPVMTGQELRFYRGEPSVKNRVGILEPDPSFSAPLKSLQPILVVCPAVAVDRFGNRLGMGKGFYDRFFQSHPHAIRVGVVHHVQVSKDPLPADSWDQPLDWIVSEEMILRTSTRRS